MTRIKCKLVDSFTGSTLPREKIIFLNLKASLLIVTFLFEDNPDIEMLKF